MVVVLDVYPARERAEDHPGVSGLTVAEAASEAARGRPVYWLPGFADAQRVLRGLLRGEDVCVVMGAGDVDELARRLVGEVGERSMSGERARAPGLPRASSATSRSRASPRSAPAERPSSSRASPTPRALVRLLAWAARAGTRGRRARFGIERADRRRGGAGARAQARPRARRRAARRLALICGGAARLPAVATRAAREGLTGIEFGVNIPGTVGGAVRMNAGAYGGQLANVLAWVEIADAGGVRRGAPDALGLGYRRSALADGEVVALACFALSAAPPEAIKETIASMRDARREAQPSGIKTFGSTFKNPDPQAADGRSAGQLLAAAGCNGLQVGGARFSPKHANFVENTGGASTADVVALMGEGRRRVLERFGVALEPEVQVLGRVRFPW